MGVTKVAVSTPRVFTKFRGFTYSPSIEVVSIKGSDHWRICGFLVPADLGTEGAVVVRPFIIPVDPTVTVLELRDPDGLGLILVDVSPGKSWTEAESFEAPSREVEYIR